MARRRTRRPAFSGGMPTTFGADVRRVRQARNMTQKGLGGATGYSEAYVSRVESGSLTPSEKFAEGCDRAFGTGDLFTESLRRLRVEHPDWFAPFVELEAQASVICDYSTNLVFGGAQTREYAWALLRAGQPLDTPEQTAAKVELRLQRGKLHERGEGEESPLLWLILDEACLRRKVGGAEVMRAQLRHLATMAEYPAVTLQVLTFASGAPPAESPFTLLDFPAAIEQPQVLYSEGQGIGQVIDSAQRVCTARNLFDRLRADALSPAQSLTFVHRMIGEHSS